MSTDYTQQSYCVKPAQGTSKRRKSTAHADGDTSSSYCGKARPQEGDRSDVDYDEYSDEDDNAQGHSGEQENPSPPAAVQGASQASVSITPVSITPVATSTPMEGASTPIEGASDTLASAVLAAGVPPISTDVNLNAASVNTSHRKETATPSLADKFLSIRQSNASSSAGRHIIVHQVAWFILYDPALTGRWDDGPFISKHVNEVEHLFDEDTTMDNLEARRITQSSLRMQKPNGKWSSMIASIFMAIGHACIPARAKAIAAVLNLYVNNKKKTGHLSKHEMLNKMQQDFDFFIPVTKGIHPKSMDKDDAESLMVFHPSGDCTFKDMSRFERSALSYWRKSLSSSSTRTSTPARTQPSAVSPSTSCASQPQSADPSDNTIIAEIRTLRSWMETVIKTQQDTFNKEVVAKFTNIDNRLKRIEGREQSSADTTAPQSGRLAWMEKLKVDPLRAERTADMPLPVTTK